MISLDNAELYESLVLWRAYQALSERLGDEDPRTSDPRDLIGKVAGYGRDRAASALYADAIVHDLDDARFVLDELLDLARAGRRPRYGNEIHPDFVTRVLTQTPNEGSSLS